MYNILICDDQPDIVNALKIYLTPEGYRLYEAFTGKEALEVVKQNDIHLILLDIMMPQMDGITATAKIREISNVPIILLTAKSETEDIPFCKNKAKQTDNRQDQHPPSANKAPNSTPQ